MQPEDRNAAHMWDAIDAGAVIRHQIVFVLRTFGDDRVGLGDELLFDVTTFHGESVGGALMNSANPSERSWRGETLNIFAAWL